jgi:excisionase family DNA binding protein
MLLTELEAAQALRISQRSLWQLAKEGKVPCIRIGRRKLYAAADLAAFIEAMKTPSAAPPVHGDSNGTPAHSP